MPGTTGVVTLNLITFGHTPVSFFFASFSVAVAVQCLTSRVMFLVMYSFFSLYISECEFICLKLFIYALLHLFSLYIFFITKKSKNCTQFQCVKSTKASKKTKQERLSNALCWLSCPVKLFYLFIYLS